MKWNALLLFFLNKKICKRLCLYVESLEHEYYMVLLNSKIWSNPLQLIPFSALSLLPKPRNKQKIKWCSGSKIKMHSILAHHKCSTIICAYRVTFNIEMTLSIDFARFIPNIYWYAEKNKCVIWIRDFLNEAFYSSKYISQSAWDFIFIFEENSNNRLHSHVFYRRF